MSSHRHGTPAQLAAFALLAPPVAWAAQLVLGYGATEAACGVGGSGQLGGLAPWAWSVIAAAVALAICALAFVAARTANRHETASGAIVFLAGAAVAVALLFGAVTLLTLVGTAALEPCSPT
jgi:hypothetical protein